MALASLFGVLAQMSTVENVITPVGFVAALIFIIKWFMKAVDERTQIIKGLAERSNGVTERSIVATEGLMRAVDRISDRQSSLEQAVRETPCLMEKMRSDARKGTQDSVR